MARLRVAGLFAVILLTACSGSANPPTSGLTASSPTHSSGTAAATPSPPGLSPVRTHAFISPSGRIDCATELGFAGADLTVPQWGKTAGMACWLTDYTYPPAPKTCAIEPIYLDALGRSGKAHKHPCSGEEAENYYGAVYPSGASWNHPRYGEVMDLDAARCTVDPRWIRCTNSAGHGFQLSREANTLF